ncbi:hypothetical protein MKK55_13015 [Methylobacterium sp. J-059]|uniref:hypothetical protein n=1 Tax=Methylobacterium sp. J-059 TaxID=2836643 RepID=UPI001FBA1420|nr:hypothetical protein [Methylobacterium sp. J-059]MCJ2039850.1 hypothetical protein [Methylobacterium sp. J-059]
MSANAMSIPSAELSEAQSPPAELLLIRLEGGIVTGRVRSNVEQPDCIVVDDAIYGAVADLIGRCRYEDGALSAYTPPPVLVPLPDNPTLSDWRVGLTLWKRDDGTLRIDEVTDKVAVLVKAGNPMGRIARERLEYANTVIRAQLIQLGPALGFSDAEIDESLWRADRVRQGDLSGVWPLPADKGAAA